MDRRIAVAHLLRVAGSLTLDHGASARGEARRSVLVIPWGAGPREPHVVVLGDPADLSEPPFADRVTVDVHVVDRRAGADVLVCPRRVSDARMARLLREAPGCAVAVGRRRGRCVVRLRDGRVLAVTSAGCPPAMYGSVVHCWRSAGLPIESLEDAVVAVGRYRAATAERPGRFLVADRVKVWTGSTTTARSAA